MKIKFHKSGRITDTEIIITCDSSVHSSLAAIEVNDFVKAAALKLARDVKTLVGEIRERDKKSSSVETKEEEKQSPWKSTVKIETVEVPITGKFVEGAVATVYAMTDHTDLLRRLHTGDYNHTLLADCRNAIEALQADNAALREELEWYQQNSGVTRDSRYAAISAAMRDGKKS